MRRNKAARILTVGLMAFFAFFLFGYVTMQLWNWLMPAIFGLRVITFWQALGLLILGKILFGGFHKHAGGRGGGWRRHMAERWEKMTPEERERFRAGMRGRRCGWFRPEDAAAAEPSAK
jgi:hypothetical protein